VHSDYSSSIRERVDRDLQKMTWEGGNGMKYISFKNSISDIRLGALQINKMNNVETRFESLQNINLFDHMIINSKTASLREMFLSMKINNTLLFIGVE